MMRYTQICKVLVSHFVVLPNLQGKKMIQFGKHQRDKTTPKSKGVTAWKFDLDT